MTQLQNLYPVQKQDVPKAGLALADAFQHDDVWKLFFKEGATLEHKGTLFESPVKYCLQYGEVYATSARLEGVAGWVPGDLADMTFWRLVRSGAILSGFKAMSACTRLAQKQTRIFEPLQAARRANMEGRAYIYLLIVGVASQVQGQGLGTKLLRALVEQSQEAGLPIYTETQTERNVRFYERLGFVQLDRITLPVIDLPHWELIREPDA